MVNGTQCTTIPVHFAFLSCNGNAVGAETRFGLWKGLVSAEPIHKPLSVMRSISAHPANLGMTGGTRSRISLLRYQVVKTFAAPKKKKRVRLVSVETRSSLAHHFFALLVLFYNSHNTVSNYSSPRRIAEKQDESKTYQHPM